MTIAILSRLRCTFSGSISSLCIGFFGVTANPVIACDGAKNIRLLEPVNISAEKLTEFRSMPPLKVLAVNAPPMAQYNTSLKTYEGIGIDVFCYIANELGVNFNILTNAPQTVAEKIQQVQTGHADVFIPLSHTSKREQHGLFTMPYYESYYAVIARKGQQFSIRNTSDLAKYQVGVVQGVALEPILQSIVPAAQLQSYDEKSSDGLFEAVLKGEIDVAVFNKNIFTEKRYRQELFDLEVIHTLGDNPRAYRYYFSQSPEHQELVEAFNRYLAVIDVSASVLDHADGERQFLERYATQRSQRVLLQAASVAAALLALFFYLASLRYRRLTKQLSSRNLHIQEQQLALQEANQKLETLSQTDGLTQLSNRRHFDQMLAYEYARYQRTGAPLSLLLIDVDHFKSINDHYGHAIGDDYLCAVARVLKNSAVRSTDLAARYGGDEFSCLLPDASLQDALRVAERIANEVAALGLTNILATPPTLTLSIGVATVTNDDPGTQKLMSTADAQLYAAKNMGRNQICSAVV